MKPMGKHKTLIENNHFDGKVKGPTYKKYKRMERQTAKRNIRKTIKDLEKEKNE